MTRNAYICDGDLWCGDCAPPGSRGPYADGGGEADAPRHCAGCGDHLENPLTEYGVSYVVSAVLDNLRNGRGNPAVLCGWWDFYADSVLDVLDYVSADTLYSAIGEYLRSRA